MSNPIFSSGFNYNQNQSDSLLDMYNQVRQSRNPEQLMQQMLAHNPQYQNVLNYIAQNGGNAETAFYNMAAQKGVDPNSILSRLR